MSEFNFAENEQINAFARELGIALRRIARQGQASQPMELPKPAEKKSGASLLELAGLLEEVEREP
jgi:hypothetical protein